MNRRRPLAALVAAVAVALLSPVDAAPSGARQEAGGGQPPITTSPESGPTGTGIELSGEGCLLPGSDVPGDGVVVRLRDGGRVLAHVTVPVAADGSWSGTLDVPAGTPRGEHAVDARCAAAGHEARDPVTYARAFFTVTGEGPGATEAAPATPPFNGGIEDRARYDGQSTCSPNTKPGMARFMRMVIRNYGGGSLGVGRACGVGGTSEHKEGRAWDWRMNAGSAGDRARVNSLFNWLFATDQVCNHHANARRLGIMYIIWNRRMFRMYDVDRGWAPYSGSSPHTDHVHFSLSRAGGAGTTSYWNPTFHAPSSWRPNRHGNQDLNMNARWDDVQPLAGDFDGDEVDDIFWYAPGPDASMVWYGRGNGSFARHTVTVNGVYEPFVGDFNGDCRDDIFFYGPGNARDAQWLGTPRRRFRSVPVQVNGNFQHRVVADFNGDRSDDILWYNPGNGPDALWQGSIYGFVKRNFKVGGNYTPLAGDFDGDRRGDIIWFRPGPAGDRVFWGKRNGGFANRKITLHSRGVPTVGDFNDDQRADIFFYGHGTAPDSIATGRKNRSMRNNPVTMNRPYAFRVAGDFDGDDGDDLFFHAGEHHPDRIWRY